MLRPDPNFFLDTDPDPHLWSWHLNLGVGVYTILVELILDLFCHITSPFYALDPDPYKNKNDGFEFY